MLAASIDSGSARISPTAHYTGAVWHRNGLSSTNLVSIQGRAFYAALAPAMALSKRLGGPTLESFLLARHTLIDHLFDQAIAQQGVRQVIEIAAGLSPRGQRFAARHGKQLTYIEADLPAMAALKAQRLALAVGASGHHRVVVLDALQPSGPGSLAHLCQGLDPDAPTAVITEGLINYFPQAQVVTLWKNIAQALQQFPSGLYLSDIHCPASKPSIVVDTFVLALSAFVRGRVGLLFDSDADAENQLQACRFASVGVHKPSTWADRLPACAQPWADLVSVVQARY